MGTATATTERREANNSPMKNNKILIPVVPISTYRTHAPLHRFVDSMNRHLEWWLHSRITFCSRSILAQSHVLIAALHKSLIKIK